MINKKSFKCPLCSKKYVTKQSLYDHMENNHKENLDGLTAAHFYFDFRNHNYTHKGRCTECGKETIFNEKTEKYNRLCNNPKCKENYVAKFRKRMYAKGRDPINDLKDSKRQLQMLENRKISGKYKWSDGKIFTYTGTYEKDFLEYLDKVLQYPSVEVFSPAPQVFKYKLDGKNHFYIPDIYLRDINLIVEVKGTSYYQQRDKVVEDTKKEAVLNYRDNDKKFNYLIVYDKQYEKLTETINELRDEE